MSTPDPALVEVAIIAWKGTWQRYTVAPGENDERILMLRLSDTIAAIEPLIRSAVAEEIAQAIEAFADDWCDWDAIIKAGDDIGALRDMASGVAHDSAAIARRIGGGGSDG